MLTILNLEKYLTIEETSKLLSKTLNSEISMDTVIRAIYTEEIPISILLSDSLVAMGNLDCITEITNPKTLGPIDTKNKSLKIYNLTRPLTIYNPLNTCTKHIMENILKNSTKEKANLYLRELNGLYNESSREDNFYIFPVLKYAEYFCVPLSSNKISKEKYNELIEPNSNDNEMQLITKSLIIKNAIPINQNSSNELNEEYVCMNIDPMYDTTLVIQSKDIKKYLNRLI